MPSFQKALDLYQGFNFKKDKQTPIGFITKLEIGTTMKLTADIETCYDPTAPTTAIKAVAVMSHFLWETGSTDALYLAGQVSTANRQVIMAQLLGGFTDISVVFNLVVFEYDPVAKKYFKAFFIDADLNGLLEKNGDDLNLTVADDPSTEVQTPKNYSFQVGIKPKATEQTINLAVGDGKNIAKKWGVTETV